MPNQPVNVVSPEGNLEAVEPQDVQSAIQNEGYKLASTADVHHYQVQQKYGEGMLDPLKASILGTARGASFGLSDQALVHSGLVKPEALQGLQEANPTASTVGEVAGVVAPAFLGDEAGLMNLPGLVSKAGTGVEHAAQSALGKVGAKALGSAVEGTAYGLGNVVSEQALGDPDLTAQSALSQVGLTALGMGAIGGTLGLASKMLPNGLLNAKEGLSRAEKIALGEPIEPTMMEKAYAKASSAISGKSEEDILNALQNRHLAMPSQSEKMNLAKDFSGALQEQYSNINKELKGTFNKVREAESKSLLNSTSPELVQKELATVKERLDQAIIAMEQEPEIYPARFSRKLEMLREGLERDTQDIAHPHDVFKAIDDLKSKLDKEIPYNRLISSSDSDAINVIRDLRGTIKTSLENPDVYGEAGVRQGEFNKAYNEYSTAEKEFKSKFMSKTNTRTGSVGYKIDPVKINTFLNQINDARGAIKGEVLTNFQKASKGIIDQMEKSHLSIAEKGFDKEALEAFMKKVDDSYGSAEKQARISSTLKSINSMGGAMGESLGVGASLASGHPIIAGAVEAYHMLRNPSMAIQRLAALEKLAQRTTSTIQKGLNRVLKPEVEKVISKVPEHDNVIDMTKVFEKRTKDIKKMANNPEGLMNDTSAKLEGVYEHAPKIADSMSQSAMAGVAFLSSKLPNTEPSDPFSEKPTPSPTQIAKFNRYYNIVSKPLNILKEAEKGTLTLEHIEAISVVYPALYSHIKTNLMEQMANNHNKSLPYRSKLMVSMLLGKNLGTSLNPLSITANQMVLHPNVQPPQVQSMPKATPARANKLTISNRTLTPLQSTIARK